MEYEFHCINKHNFTYECTYDNPYPKACPSCQSLEIHSYNYEKNRCITCEQEDLYKIPPQEFQNPPILGHLYDFKEIQPNWLKFLGFWHDTHPIPTEVVVYEPQIVTPIFARSYHTTLSLRENKIYDCEELQAHDRNYKGYDDENLVTMHEYWENYGDDGHVHYTFYGFLFVDLKTFEKTFNKEKNSPGQKPAYFKTLYKIAKTNGE